MASLLPGAAIVFAALAFMSAPAAAQEVRLASPDGAIDVTGPLQSFDGAFYRIDTIHGPLTLAVEDVACTGAGCPTPGTFVGGFTIAGAPSTTGRLVPALITSFADATGADLHVTAEGEERHFHLRDRRTHQPAMRIVLRMTPGDGGLVDLVSGNADLALSFSALRDDAVQVRVAALDAFVPVVAPQNPVRRITLPQLAATLSGAIEDWGMLGGAEEPISVHTRTARTAAHQALEARLLAPVDLAVAQGAQRHEAEADLLDAVAGDPAGLGIAVRSGTGGTVPLDIVGACGFGPPASAEALKAEDYPLTAPILLHARAERLPLQLRAFLDHLESDSARAAIRSIGLVDRFAEATPLAGQGERLADAIRAAGEDVSLEELQRLAAAMDGGARLTTTFRFEAGTTELDIQSRANIAALANDIAAGLHDGHEIIFAGFTDGDGQAEANLRLSRLRAESVRDAVAAAAAPLLPGVVKLEADGFGEAMPLACDDSDLGRRVNRRVEVWRR